MKIYKAKVYERKVKRTFFLAEEDRIFPFIDAKIEVNSMSNEIGFVGSEIKFDSWSIIMETNQYIREFVVNEYLNTCGKDYKIVGVSHSDDGAVHYMINKEAIIEDIESKIKAESDLEERKQILMKRKDKAKENEITDINASVEKVINEIKEEKRNKKWYQFWI
ncbi:hypothetical protein ACFQZE_06455 [Paenibacillus sp. GCM10027627]|uniref:hypothetical protein n=1 Tax=unclassified Paenibacillus TaxID=185978 RepID=UPI0036319329